jgi:hypothetical protein
MAMHDRESAKIQMQLESDDIKQKAGIINIAADSTKADGRNLLVIKGFYSKPEVTETALGVDFLIDTTAEDGKCITAGAARSYCNSILSWLLAWSLPLTCVLFVVVDSCTTNTGAINGLVALLSAEAAKQGSKMYIIHCYAHILHNAVEHGIKDAWGRDQSKAREGANSPVAFMLEGLAARVRAEWDKLGLSCIKCPECITTQHGPQVGQASACMLFQTRTHHEAILIACITF